MVIIDKDLVHKICGSNAASPAVERMLTSRKWVPDANHGKLKLVANDWATHFICCMPLTPNAPVAIFDNFCLIWTD